MIIESHRCKNCGIKYQYQRSGYGCFDQKCTEIYCSDCSNLINDFLIKSGTKDRWVPKYIETDEISYEDVFKNSIKSNFISVSSGFQGVSNKNGTKYYVPYSMCAALASIYDDVDRTIKKVYKKMAYDTVLNRIDGEW